MRAVRQMIGTLLICILFLCVFSHTSASAYTAQTVTIPVSCAEVSGVNNDTYHIKLTPGSPKYPMPASDTISVTEGEEGKFEFKVSEPGTYTYKIDEIPGDVSIIDYDETEYIVTVYVENKPDSDELNTPAIVVNVANKEDKPDGISFRHTIKQEDQPVAVDDDVTIVTRSPTSAPIAVDGEIKQPSGRMDNASDNPDLTVMGTEHTQPKYIDSGNAAVNPNDPENAQVPLESQGDQPQTNDRSRYKAWFVILCAAALVAVMSGTAIVRYKKRKAEAK